MKTGSQSSIFDYDTGDWNKFEGDIPQTTSLIKPPFAAVGVSLLGETFEEQMVRLGKISPKKKEPREEEKGEWRDILTPSYYRKQG